MHKRILTGVIALAVSAACLAAPNYAELRRTADASLAKKNYTQAIKEFEKLVYLFPDNSEAYNGLGYALYLDGRYENAILRFKEALTYNPNNQSAQQNLILAVGKRAVEQTRDLEFSEALTLLSNTEALFANNPQSLVLRYSWGQLQFYRGKPEEGLAAWRYIAQKLPDSGTALFLKAYELHKAHKTKEALPAFVLALKRVPADPVFRNYYGETLMEAGKTDAAIGVLSKAVKSDAPYPDMHLNLAKAYQRKGNLDKAIEEVKAARTVRPDFASLHLLLAALDRAKGNTENASRELGLALADDKRPALLVTSATPGAAVWVDGEPVGLTPTGLFLKPGKHALKVQNGKTSATASVETKAGEVSIATAGDSINVEQSDASTMVPTQTPAYNFALRDQGNKFWRSFQHFHKRPVVLLFWKAGDPSVQETLNGLSEVASKYQDKIGCAVIHTNMEKKSQALSQMMNYPAVFARLFDDGEVMARYKITNDQLPRVVLVDLDGYVAYSGQGLAGIKEMQPVLDKMVR